MRNIVKIFFLILVTVPETKLSFIVSLPDLVSIDSLLNLVSFLDCFSVSVDVFVDFLFDTSFEEIHFVVVVC